MSDRMRGAGWCAKPKMERNALNFGGACRTTPANSRGGLWEVGEGLLEGLGAMEPEIHKGGGLLIPINQ